MAIDGFLTFPDIVGESQRRGHEDEIEVHDIAFAMAAPQSASGARRGRVVLRPLTVRKFYDRASPYLKTLLQDGRHADRVSLAVTRTREGSTRDYLVITLREVSLVSYELSTTEDGRLEELLTLAYRRITFTYEGQHEVELETQGVVEGLR